MNALEDTTTKIPANSTFKQLRINSVTPLRGDQIKADVVKFINDNPQTMFKVGCRQLVYDATGIRVSLYGTAAAIDIVKDYLDSMYAV